MVNVEPTTAATVPPSPIGDQRLPLRDFIRSFRCSPGLSRLLAVRLGSQFTDGLFQAALGGAILFNPERHADPMAVAAGMAVLLLPYSVIGPFAGALLDHWDRRTVLVWANVLRAVLVSLVAIVIATGTGDTGVLIAALAVTGASRFVASGLSAGLPHVAAREHLVGMNSFFTTIGAGALAAGAGGALVLREIFGSDNTGSAATTMGAVVVALIAAFVAHRFEPLQLGPDHPDIVGGSRARNPAGSALRAVAVGLGHGARAVWKVPSVAAALSAVGAHRLVFGVNTLVLLVLTKHSSLGGGLTGFGLVAGMIAVGMFLAAVITPFLVARIGRTRAVVSALAVGALAQIALCTFNGIVICVAAVVLGLIGQVCKLCADAAMQMDVDDARRGQAFSFQDALFNFAFVGAVFVAALTIADNGMSPDLIIAGSVVYVVAIFVVRVINNRTSPEKITI
ncbi:MFS transporter [Williamsia sp. DF01-3]|uniref:MFS transporter n=1 Tax=Williamsia sp. DF01-3 TaxID=2934157 RepID=UPI001FF4DB55|nr:MFS transporter [Williamsia sp. DF01-3]MCK0516300.1 MFS transporter [Williamsia sp. DF01-3]